MESAMVPSFSFLHLYTILSHTGHGKRYGTTSKSNAIPQLTISPYLFLTYTEKFSDERVSFPNVSEMFFEKMKKFSPLGNISGEKREKFI